MNREEKSTTVDELKDVLSRAQSLVITDFRGMTVAQTSELRSEIRKQGCQYKVLKNTLVERAVAGTPMEGIAKFLKGPTAIAFSYADPVAPAKVIAKFETDLEHLKVKGGFVDGQVLEPQGVKSLATMKGKDELRAQFLATLQAPAQGLVRLLAAAPQQFLYLLQAREREASGQG